MKDIKICVVVTVAVICAIALGAVNGKPFGPLGQSLTAISEALVPKNLKSTKVNKDDICDKVKCEKPPRKANCTIVEKNDTSVTHPVGDRAECCPLWRCQERKKKTNFFTFHGIMGEGSETVKYTSSRSDNKGAFNIVESVASGSHNAKAIAGDSQQDPSVYMQEMSKTFQKFGMDP